MKGGVFRLGHMGYAAEFDVIAALAALEQILADLGLPVDLGSAVRAAQKIFSLVPPVEPPIPSASATPATMRSAFGSPGNCAAIAGTDGSTGPWESVRSLTTSASGQ